MLTKKTKKKKGKRVLSKLSTFRKLFDIFAFVTLSTLKIVFAL